MRFSPSEVCRIREKRPSLIRGIREWRMASRETCRVAQWEGGEFGGLVVFLLSFVFLSFLLLFL